MSSVSPDTNNTTEYPPASESRYPAAPEYRYLDELGLSEPVLLLVYRGDHQLVEGRTWHHIRHQCAGNACRQRDIMGTVLTPRGTVAMGLAQLAARWEGSLCGMWNLRLEDVVRYQGDLQALGLDCEEEFSDLLEGYYPIDMPESLTDIIEDDLPDDLDEMIAWENPPNSSRGALERLFGAFRRWQLVLLGPNCD